MAAPVAEREANAEGSGGGTRKVEEELAALRKEHATLTKKQADLSKAFDKLGTELLLVRRTDGEAERGDGL